MMNPDQAATVVERDEEILRVFSSNYSEARDRFRAAARRWQCRLEEHGVGCSAPDGSELTIDVAILGPESARRTVILSSGTHGVEAFFGSASQLAFLATDLKTCDWHRDTAVVLIHALNPFGFAWSRRFNEDNVDLNRNFLLPGQEFADLNSDYARFDNLLNPRGRPRRLDGFYLRAFYNILRFGLAKLKNAVASGQYSFDKGLFFGGERHSRSQQVLKENLARWLGEASEVLHVDLHTGMGRWGSYKLLTHHSFTSPSGRALQRIFGAESIETLNPEGLLYEVRGGLTEWLEEHLKGIDYKGLYAEFGTYNIFRVTSSLRMENQAHHWASAEDGITTMAKARLVETFCPSSPAWRKRVLSQSLELVQRALQSDWA